MAENEPFFPTPDIRDENGCGLVQGFTGLTMRDWFAGQALQGIIITCSRDTRAGEIGHSAYYTERSYEIADAMMEARK